jgi:hypothetical protein
VPGCACRIYLVQGFRIIPSHASPHSKPPQTFSPIASRLARQGHSAPHCAGTYPLSRTTAWTIAANTVISITHTRLTLHLRELNGRIDPQ